MHLAMESSTALGSGFRCGFLGMLHLEVCKQRIEDEFGLEVLATAPSVPYKLKRKKHCKPMGIEDKDGFITVQNALEMPIEE